jgi:parallel beta-helix repeat protein
MSQKAIVNIQTGLTADPIVQEKFIYDKTIVKNMKMCLIIIFLILGSTNASKISVGAENSDYINIQQAINNASPKDIIEVQSGTYHENIIVFQDVSLIGINTGKGLPVIDADGGGSVVMLLADGITLEGFNITNSGHCECGNAGIYVRSNNSNVFNNIIYRNMYGIYVTKGKRDNRFFLNELVDNNITAYDCGENKWEACVAFGDNQDLLKSLASPVICGNYYSDYDEPKEGCYDVDKDGFCDKPRHITGGHSIDNHPSEVDMTQYQGQALDSSEAC